jgi:glutathione S-transferase
MSVSLPILYSFRRCPYAMRARMAMVYSQLICELREVDFKCKPATLLEISPKGTVPVLCLADGEVIDESLDIMEHALKQHDPDGWNNLSDIQTQQAKQLIKRNDSEFVHVLRAYKYFERYPEQSKEYYREQCQGEYIDSIEGILGKTAYLLGDNVSIADIALLPFIRQFAGADQAWFDGSPYGHTKRWLNQFLGSDMFQRAMVKHPAWKEGDVAVVFP